MPRVEALEKISRSRTRPHSFALRLGPTRSFDWLSIAPIQNFTKLVCAETLRIIFPSDIATSYSSRDQMPERNLLEFSELSSDREHHSPAVPKP